MTAFNFNGFYGALLILSALAWPAWAADPVITANPLYPDAVTRRLGLQDPDQGALPNDFWQGAAAVEILPLLDALPAQPSLPIAQQLQLRLLLATATPPEGALPQIWLAHRLQKLVAMRAYHEAAQLYYLAWATADPSDNAQLTLTILHIAANESSAACLHYLAARTGALNTAWQYVQAYCASSAPQLIATHVLPASDPRTALVPQLRTDAAARQTFAEAMLPPLLPSPPSVAEPGAASPAMGLAWLQNNPTGQPALMHLHGLIALHEGDNKNLVRQRWQANGLGAEAQSLSSGKLPAPPPEE